MAKAPLLLAAVLTAFAGQAMSAQSCDTTKVESTPKSRFKNNGDGTITDTKTKLVWRACAAGMTWGNGACEGQSTTFNFSMAKLALEDLNDAKDSGRSNWRFPSRDELHSIVETSCFKPAINLNVFSFSPESGFWTKDIDEGVSVTRSWIVHFIHGQSYVANQNQSWRLRPVSGK